ncbi:MAG: sigma-70 family RNA polymerase sigma factor [Ruminococcus sp.]|nr:sigma-70 family RNA polymerase sigma factor [Ruminococcus sp.]
MNNIEELYNTYFHDVYLYIKSVSRDDEIAQEITQDTFFKAMKSLDSFKGECSVKSWLCQIAKNLFYNQCKKQNRFTDGEIPADIPDTQICFEEKISDTSQALEIHRILHTMEEPYKEVFSLRIFSELSFKQIADIFGKTESWARVTFHRAKVKIIDELEEKYE